IRDYKVTGVQTCALPISGVDMATVIVMPRLSPTMEEGVLVKWTKKEGDKIAPGDVIAEVETDKANMDFPLEDEGVLLKLLVKERSEERRVGKECRSGWAA